MKKFIIYIAGCLLGLSTSAQVNYSGAYGYSFPPIGDSPKNENAKGASGSLILLKMENNKYRFWLDVTIGWPSYNMGETDGTITFVNDTASFDNSFEDASAPCILKFRIKGDVITIDSKSSSFNCGFGNAVNADGDYTRLKNQPVLNNDWLKKEYNQSPIIVITADKATVYEDENCIYAKKQYFVKGDKLLSIAETEKTVYVEYIPSPGKFVYGWIKKTMIKETSAE